ncbi:MAG: hypothetical protein WC603_02650 [Candidatus Paceibacterota bacterium]|jgi:hypothetical protein
MEIEKIYEYPELIVKSIITDRLRVIMNLSKQFDDEKPKLDQAVLSIQENCRHNLKKIMMFDKNYNLGIDNHNNSVYGDYVLRGKECIHCGAFFPRKDDVKICRKCGNGQWEFTPIPGCIGGETRQISTCKNCGHRIEQR